jgi:hypothetical protein
MVMPDFPTLSKDGTSAWRQQREPTKLESGILGALLASIGHRQVGREQAW